MRTVICLAALLAPAALAFPASLDSRALPLVQSVSAYLIPIALDNSRREVPVSDTNTIIESIEKSTSAFQPPGKVEDP